MSDDQDFVDYYAVLQVEWDCDARTLELAYHFLAKMYHPDNSETADVDKFAAVIDAYRALRNPEDRARYDRVYESRMGNPKDRFSFDAKLGINEITALDDAELHATLLSQLYRKRREHPHDPGIVGWLLQEKLNCSENLFEFHVWYLKSKGLLDITEEGTLAITVAGVDHIIATSRKTLQEKLRIAQRDRTPSTR